MKETFNSRWQCYPKENKKSAASKILLYLIWPFGTWLYSLRHPQYKSSYVIFFLFSLLLCWHMSPISNSSYDDFLGIKDRFESASITTSSLLYELHAFFTMADDSPKEIYEDILTWFVKSFTNNYHFFFLLAAIPIALCQLKSMKRITGDTNFKPTIWGICIVIMLIFPRDIITTQNPRFATGFWICVVSALYFYGSRCKNWWYLLLALMAPLCHAGLMPFVFLLFVSVFVPKDLKLLKYVALASIPFSFFDAGIFANISFDFLPGTLNRWVAIYLSDEAYAQFILKEGKAGFWWVDAGFQMLLKFAYIWMTLQIIRHWDKVESNSESSSIISFYLLLFTFVNFTQFVPEFSTRYYNFLRVFCVYVWFKTFGLNTKYLSSIKFLMLASSWFFFNRYGYVIGGALSVNTPIDIFFMPLPYLIGKGLLW